MTGIEVTVDPASLRKLEEIRAKGLDVHLDSDQLRRVERIGKGAGTGLALLFGGAAVAGLWYVFRGGKKGRG